MRLEGIMLRSKRPRQLVVHIREESERLWSCSFLRCIERGDGFFSSLLAHRLLRGYIPPAQCLHPAAKANDWAAGLPVRPLIVPSRLRRLSCPVLRVVVGCRVCANAVCHRLNQTRPPLGGRDFPRAFRRRHDCEQVVPVHTDGGHPEREATWSHAVRHVLVPRVRRDGIPIVAAEEDGRAAVHRCDVERRGHVAFGGTPLAEVCDRHLVAARSLHAVRHARRVGALRAERALHVEDVPLLRAHVQRQLPAMRRIFLVGAQLVRYLLEAEASPEEGAHLAILRQDPIGRPQRCDGANGTRLLAPRGEEERDAPLPLRVVEDLLELVDAEHRPHARQRDLLLEGWHRRVRPLDRQAHVVDQAEARQNGRSGVDVWVPELELRRELALRADEFALLIETHDRCLYSARLRGGEEGLPLALQSGDGHAERCILLREAAAGGERPARLTSGDSEQPSRAHGAA
mmetsp:Transcript_47879/g.118567  ORF Transcript_47879/g.118567 Transcript_47879/m.118567 type:complete len:459 (+) Transcript_47879:153-1529(+)